LLCLPLCAAAQGQTSRYVYDDDGRLLAVIAPNGEAVVYEYDAAGNFTAVRRLDVDALELLTFAPRSGVAGTRVVFYGVGFSAGVSAVNFGGGGVAGTLVDFTNTTVTALVPGGAATGPVTITTAPGTLTTAAPFTIQGITLDPKEASALDGQSIQFNATVILPGEDQEITWSVNGTEGGDDTSGTITAGGLYTPPPDPPATFQVSIQATSVAIPTIIGTAVVHVRSLSDFRFALSPGVSVGKGAEFTFGAALSRAVSVSKGAEFGAFSPAISLTNGPVITSVSPGSAA
jgi:YD repeat-containing protein